jgi:prepilin peptidase CpaA
VLSVVWFIFAAAMVTAATIDLISYRIPNTLVLALTALFLIVAAVNWTEVAWLNHIAAAILVFGAGIFLYALKQMGAGDVKLLGVVALWSGVNALSTLLVFVSVCGLLGMLVILALRLIVPRLQAGGASPTRTLPRVLTRGQGIPYAVGIGPGAIIASLISEPPFAFAPWLWHF